MIIKEIRSFLAQKYFDLIFFFNLDGNDCNTDLEFQSFSLEVYMSILHAAKKGGPAADPGIGPRGSKNRLRPTGEMVGASVGQS